MKAKTKFALKVSATLALTATAVYCVYKLGREQELVSAEEAETIADNAETIVTTIADGAETVANFFRK